MASIHSLPNECLLHILQNCENTSQAIALSSTCKRVHTVYLSNKYTIRGQYGLCDIPAFNEAVMAVRATGIVMNHFQKGQFPPDPFPLPSSVEAQESTSDEVRQVLDLEHLIRCIEDICLHNTEWGRECYYRIKQAESETPSTEWFTWRRNFRCSMYRSLMMGAVLCRAYQEPLAPSNKSDHPESFLENCDARMNDPDEPILSSDEMRYLLKFPVFNFEAYNDHHPLYRQLAGFWREQTENRQKDELDTPDMYPEDAKPEKIDRDHAKELYAEMLQCLLSSMTLLNHEGSSQIFKEEDETTEEFSREVTIIPLGSFYPERITMPANPQNAHQTLLLKKSLPQNEGSTAWHPSSRLMNLFLDVMYSSSGQPNRYGEGYPTPPPPLQVFQYIFRTFLGLRFSEDAFEEEDVEAAHKMFVNHPLICNIFLDWWPDEVPTLVDTLDGEGDYETSYE